MGLVQKKAKIERDQFTEDGVRLFNASKPHGVVYSDGYLEVKYIQEYDGEEVHYRGDGAPCGYAKGKPLRKSAPELLTENELLHGKVRDLEAAQQRTLELLERLMAQSQAKAPEPAAKVEAPAAASEREAPQDLEDVAQPNESAARPTGTRGTARPK